jgi:4-hydroxy-3-methylbut-2-en-1-yl diphosphate reductase
MRVIRAEHMGMCFGVRDAIALALNEAKAQPLSILGDLVHNERVLSELQARGVRIVADAGEVETKAVMITAHGASQKAIDRARARGLAVTESTCPLVRVAHQALCRLVREGYHPVVIGKREHVEVRGMTEDLAECDVVLSVEDIPGIAARPRLGIVAQTTQPIERVRQLVDLIRQRFPASQVRFVDTVCRPTKLRQHSAVELAQQSEVVVVIGGAHSNNTHELVRTCSRYCPRVHHVRSTGDLRSEWFEGVERVGVTAGTSTPDALIDEVERWLVCLPSNLPATGTGTGRREAEHTVSHLQAA